MLGTLREGEYGPEAVFVLIKAMLSCRLKCPAADSRLKGRPLYHHYHLDYPNPFTKRAIIAKLSRQSGPG